MEKKFNQELAQEDDSSDNDQIKTAATAAAADIDGIEARVKAEAGESDEGIEADDDDSWEEEEDDC